jgi:hypothetical protein
MLLVIPASLTADINVGNGPSSDVWQALAEKEYSLDAAVPTPAVNICSFFGKTTNFSFVCSEELSQERVAIQMKAPFGEVFEVFLEQLHAECYFGATYVFIARQGDPGLGKYSRPQNVPEKMREMMALDFRDEKLSEIAEFMVGVTGIPIEFAPDLGSRFVTIHVDGIPFIDAMECMARYLGEPIRIDDEGIYGSMYIGNP